MSFDPPARRRAASSWSALAFFLLLGLWSVACGHKASPKPPPSKIPQRAVLTAHQRGSESILEFPFPTTTISGTPLPGVSRIEAWRFAMEVPEFAVELLTEEAAARKEAQDLLDELGLTLYETSFGTPESGGVDPLVAGTREGGELADPFATGLPASDETSLVPPDEPAAAGAPLATAPPETEPDEAVGPEDDAADGDTAEEGDGAEDAVAEGEEGAEPELTPEEELALRVEVARNTLRSPPTLKSSFIAATAKEFKQGSELVLTVEGEDVAGTVVGDIVVLRLPLPPRSVEGAETGYLFGVTVYALNGKASDLSNTVAMLPEDVPPAPREVSVEAQPDGVLLQWTREEEPPEGYRIYRRDAQSRTYGTAHAIVPGVLDSYVDRQAVFGARYIYGVTAVASPIPLLESDISSEHEVDYQDRFGPAVPGGLVAFPEAGRVRLLWTPVSDPDLAGYEIRRRAADSEDAAQELTDELVTRSQYLDEAVATGEVWLYSVVAIDQLGNRSEASLEVQARVP